MCMSVHLCDCVLAGGQVLQQRRTQLSRGRLPVWSTSWQQLLADPRVWPPLSSARRRPSPASTGLARSPFPEPHCFDAASWGLNSGNWVVNILKCSSTWVYFTPVIRYFQCICYGCWTEDYCTYRSYYITVSCCSFCEAVSFQSKMKCLLRSYIMLLSPIVTGMVWSDNGKNEIDWQPRQLCSIVHQSGY